MTRTRQSVGRFGEDQAVRHITGLGWQVLDRNWRCREGELDIVAVDDEGCVVFIEVKTRRGTGYGTPLESVTWKKSRTLMAIAHRWLSDQERWFPSFRIDAIGILMRPGRPVELTHVRGIGAW